MSETPALFGPHNTLVGVFDDAGGAAGICCLLINAGVLPRVGPNRLNVKISRALAQRGIASMRFDLAGLGDSKPAAGAASYEEQAALDIRAAMDFVGRSGGPRKFVIFGICSGAVNAFRGALLDERVVGVLMLDGFWYLSRWSEPMRLLKRLRSRSFADLFAALRRRLLPRPKAAGGAESADIFAIDSNGNPPKQDFARDANALVARGVQIFFLYTGSVPQQVSYQNQLRHAFAGEAFVKKARIELHDDLDHTAVPLRAQRKLLGIVGDWAEDVATRNGAKLPGTR
jgi:pimeloyl-ACP methyl ester carboxylesterase